MAKKELERDNKRESMLTEQKAAVSDVRNFNKTARENDILFEEELNLTGGGFERAEDEQSEYKKQKERDNRKRIDTFNRDKLTNG